jgi:RNA polymerase sigma-70 factor (ECF subfamily)
MTLNSPDDDRSLIRRVRAGDERALLSLHRRHTPRLRAVILRLSGYDEDLAEDLVQTTWIRALEGLGSFRGESAFATWLIAIGTRLTFAHARTQERRRELGAAQAPAIAVEPPPLVNFMAVEAAIGRLSAVQRTVLVLHAIEGYGHAEIAALLDIAEGTSRATLSRARRALRTQLRGGTTTCRTTTRKPAC